MTQHFENGARQLWHLVKEEHTIMRQTNLSWLRIVAATHKGYLRDGMMGSAEGTLANQTGVAVQLSCHTVYLCRL